jgi:hypothetical protein
MEPAFAVVRLLFEENIDGVKPLLSMKMYHCVGTSRLFILFILILLLLTLAGPVCTVAYSRLHATRITNHLPQSALLQPAPVDRPMRSGCQGHPFAAPGLFIEPYVRPELAARMEALRPTILAAAARHNRPRLSGMSDTQFAEVIALLMYNEHNGWLEDEVEVLRVLTPFYEHAQVSVNSSGLGSNFSVWPSNLRPSVALEILEQQVPVPAPTRVITVPLQVAGSSIIPANYTSQEELFAAITREISQDELAIEYLAANLERGMYRARFEDIPVSWRTLAAWHNQGIVQPQQIRANPTATVYVQRTSAYLLVAHQLIHAPSGQSVADGSAYVTGKP